MAKMTQGERIAVLETQMQNQQESLDAMQSSMAAIAKAQQEMLTELTRYRTIWGVVTMLVTALFAVVGFAKDWLISAFR
jgi:hypothetical protein